MPTDQHNVMHPLRALAAGNLDDLTPAQVEELESALNNDPALAAAVAAQRPPMSPSLAAALSDLDRHEQPSAMDWERVWSAIDTATATAQTLRAGAARRLIRVLRPVLAAAACLLLVVGWRINLLRPAEAWPLQLADDVEIDQLEVFQEATTFVVSMGDHGGQIIWVLPAADNL